MSRPVWKAQEAQALATDARILATSIEHARPGGAWNLPTRQKIIYGIERRHTSDINPSPVLEQLQSYAQAIHDQTQDTPMTDYADDLLNALTITTIDHAEGRIDHHEANSTYLGIIASSLVAILRQITTIANGPTPAAGSCTSIMETQALGIYDVQTCEHPHDHTGAHHSTQDGNHLWTDGARGERRIDHPSKDHTKETTP